ncbi:MAG: flagellar biosynthetic protein FliR [Bacteroidetes bacterium]|nr:flagellar biosynthetic protein FliR [Bacteroidota bacterium]
MTDILVNDFVFIIMIFLRVFSAFATAPIFGHQSIPVTIKVFLAMMISYIIGLSLHDINVNIPLDIWSMSLIGIKEVLTGTIIGFSLNFIFYGISFAGHIMGFQMGLAISQIFDPVTEMSGNVVGEILVFAAFMVFFIINGHHYIIQALAYSFRIIPVGGAQLTGTLTGILIDYSAGIFVLAIKISSPILISFFLVQVAEGILARALPQMQVFFVTQPIKLGLGFVLISMIIPIYIYVIKNLLKGYEDSLLNIIKGMVENG